MTKAGGWEAPETVRRIGRYEILAGLSTGGMAELYLAHLIGPGGYRKFIALKKILPDVQQQERFVRMFIDEARITATLSHANIAPVYELGNENGELFLAMEYVLGLDLSRVARASKKLHGQPLPLGLSCRLAHDICLALDHAHRHLDEEGKPAPVIHRDVSPRNLMVTFDGTSKVIDFGLALAQNRMEKTAAGTIKGTAAYMSPEQVYARPLDGRSDLYSTGAVLHELLTGQKLFAAAKDEEALLQIASGKVPSPAAINPAVPVKIADVVLKALSYDRAQRFATGKEMAQAIAEAAGERLFDHAGVATFMRQTFRDRFNEIRALLNLAMPKPPRSRGLLPGSYTFVEPPPQEEVTEPKVSPHGPKALKDAILVVDPDPDGLRAVESALRAANHEVVTASDPAEAVALQARHQPSLLLVNGDAAGFALARQLRATTGPDGPPMLFLARTCLLEQRTEGLLAGGDDFLYKPFEPSDLVTRVRDHLQAAETKRAMLTNKRWRRSGSRDVTRSG